MTEGLNLTIPQRLAALRISITITLFCSLLFSYNLWLNDRSFPLSPVSEIFVFQNPVNISLLILSLGFLIFGLFATKKRLFLFLFLVCSFALVLADVTRLQPWFYVYASMLLICIFYNGRVDDANNYTAHFTALQIVFASIYFFSGIHRFQNKFSVYEFENLITPLKNILSERQFLFALKAGSIVPYILSFIGIALLIKPLRYLAISFSIFIHVILLILIFPSASQQNVALWFCNFSNIALILILFSGKTTQQYFSPSYLFKATAFYFVLIFFVLSPSLNSVNILPSFFSPDFTSVNNLPNKRAIVRIDENAFKSLPLYERSFCRRENDLYIFDCARWCNHELNAALLPEKPVYSSINNYLLHLGITKAGNPDLALNQP